MSNPYDFEGWATRANMRCSDGRTIMKDAFKHCNGTTVPLVWNHQHNDPLNIIGHALLENREEGVYTYCRFNNTELGKHAKELVQHGDITALSIYANRLKQQGGNVIHGAIREVSLVIAGANPGAYIESVLKHADSDEEEARIFTGEHFSLCHADDNHEEKENVKMEDENKKQSEQNEKTLQEVYDSMTEEQKECVAFMVGAALEEKEDDEINHSDEEGNEMKKNVFEKEDTKKGNVLCHADQLDIIELAKTAGVGSLKQAMAIYAEENTETLSHGFDAEAIGNLFPDYKDVNPGAPELLERDQTWVGTVMKKAHKSPISRIRTRQADARAAEIRAKGYQNKGDQKTLSGQIKLLSRTTDPQTVYRKDEMHRDDIVDITDFDSVAYIRNVMRHNLEEDIALAALIGDGRDDGDPDKIHEDHIRSIWHDEELYTIHTDVDIEAAKAELQGSNTGVNFGENYVYAEAVISSALYARENYKGSGNVDLFCAPHMLNVMLLARDLNGRRIYDSRSDLAAALNVNAIHTVEQFEGRTRTTKEGKEKKLLGLFVNMADYQFGATKGGEITSFNQFDIDFNKEKFLMEARLSGALTRIKAAIALEEPVNA